MSKNGHKLKSKLLKTHFNETERESFPFIPYCLNLPTGIYLRSCNSSPLESVLESLVERNLFVLNLICIQLVFTFERQLNSIVEEFEGLSLLKFWLAFISNTISHANIKKRNKYQRFDALSTLIFRMTD